MRRVRSIHILHRFINGFNCVNAEYSNVELKRLHFTNTGITKCDPEWEMDLG